MTVKYSLKYKIRRLKRIVGESFNEAFVNVFFRDYNKRFEENIESKVKKHLEVLKESKYHNNEDSTYQQVKSLYRSYCPTDFFHLTLNKKNKEKYFWLRLEIDKALEESEIIRH